MSDIVGNQTRRDCISETPCGAPNSGRFHRRECAAGWVTAGRDGRCRRSDSVPTPMSPSCMRYRTLAPCARTDIALNFAVGRTLEGLLMSLRRTARVRNAAE